MSRPRLGIGPPNMTQQEREAILRRHGYGEHQGEAIPTFAPPAYSQKMPNPVEAQPLPPTYAPAPYSSVIAGDRLSQIEPHGPINVDNEIRHEASRYVRVKQ